MDHTRLGVGDDNKKSKIISLLCNNSDSFQIFSFSKVCHETKIVFLN